MTSRRVRRDSETSTDSWSLVEEDRLDDDFSLNSTEAEEEYDEEVHEPIVEEPPTSDEEEDVTASEDDDTSDDSDCDSDSSDSEDDEVVENSDDSDLSTAEEEEEEEEEVMKDANSDVSEAEEEENEDVEDSDDSDDDSEDSEVSEVSEDEEEEDLVDSGEEEEEITEEEAARLLKEDEEWMDEEEQLNQSDSNWPVYALRAAFFLSIFISVFPIADICTSYVLTHKAHFFKSHIPASYSQQRCFHATKGFLKEIMPTVKFSSLAAALLQEEPQYKFQTADSWSKGFPQKNIKTLYPPKPSNTTITIPKWATAPVCQKALAPIPPAPFTPRRRLLKRVEVPRHQPCLVHVNESKWTCQKRNSFTSTEFKYPIRKINKNTGITVVTPRRFGVSKRKMEKRNQERIPAEICGKKASESMRTVMMKSKDQCDSRHVSKYSPKRRHFQQNQKKHAIEYKAPLPCSLPTYRPTMPKPSRKPSNSAGDDWFSRRSHVRAQLRSRA